MKSTSLVSITMVVVGSLLTRSHAIASLRRGAVAMSRSPARSSSITVVRRSIDMASVPGAGRRRAAPARPARVWSRRWSRPAVEAAMTTSNDGSHEGA
jgi:hypothetical protein